MTVVPAVLSATSIVLKTPDDSIPAFISAAGMVLKTSEDSTSSPVSN